LAHKMRGGYGEQQARDTVATIGGVHAQLGDVAALRADARAKYQRR
jgi:hypothetical protein